MYDNYFNFYLFLGHFVITNFLAVFFSLMFESPFIGLEKIIFGKGPPKERSQLAQDRQAEEGDGDSGEMRNNTELSQEYSPKPPHPPPYNSIYVNQGLEVEDDDK